MTRANVYTGLAGFYLIRGGRLDDRPAGFPAQRVAMRSRIVVIQDRSFNANGSLFFPTTAPSSKA